jgi:peptide alpha-N-acetyltransferase
MTWLPSHPLTSQIVLETEHDNFAALSLYESLGFIREKRLYRFYLNGKDAFRLILTIPPESSSYKNDFDGGMSHTTRPILISSSEDHNDEVSSR